MIGLALISDGRWEYLTRTLASLRRLNGIDEWVLVNDSGQPCPLPVDFPVVEHPQRRGLAAAVRSAWDYATDAGWSHLMHWEEDFTLVPEIDARELARLVDQDVTLAQVTLKRQAWSPPEVEAGGIIHANPDLYTDGPGVTYHQACCSLNPSLFPRRIFSTGWPDENEAGKTAELVAQGYRFAFYGQKYDPPTVTHIGARRSMAWTP